MCPACGHPQEAAEKCSACGAILPTPLREQSAPEPPRPASNQAAPPRPAPPLRSSVRVGQSELFLRGDALEIHRGGRTRSVPTAALAGFQLSRRPMIEALVAGFAFAGLAALVHSRDLRLLLLLLDLLMLAAAFAYNRYRFAALTRDKELIVASMVVRRRSQQERELREGLAAVRAFLTLRGVTEGK